MYLKQNTNNHFCRYHLLQSTIVVLIEAVFQTEACRRHLLALSGEVYDLICCRADS